MMARIKKIIAESKEPVYDLGDFFDHLQIEQRKEFWKEIYQLAQKGTTMERSVTLSLISVHRKDLFKPILEQTVRDTTIVDAETEVVLPLLLMIEEGQYSEYKIFCKVMFDKSVTSGDSVLRDRAFRSLLVISWEEVLQEIKHKIRRGNKNSIVDLAAYFKFLHETDWTRLLKLLDDVEREKVIALLPEIDQRVKGHYEILRSENNN